MKVTAEGVETADQQLFLRAAGVHSMQGFRFGRPVTVAEISRASNRPAHSCPPKHLQLSRARAIQYRSPHLPVMAHARFYDMRASRGTT
jgi:sensor c-di-GMP phosphodiesterase-like protein